MCRPPSAWQPDGRIVFLAHVHDIRATILRLLGLDHERLTYFQQGREESLTDVHGRVIREVLAERAGPTSGPKRRSVRADRE